MVREITLFSSFVILMGMTRDVINNMTVTGVIINSTGMARVKMNLKPNG
jgi:hypothetical protein